MRMEVHPTTTITRLLLDGAVDVGLAESAAEGEGINSSVFMKDRMTAIAPPKNPLAKRASISAEELCREPFVVRELGSGSKSLVERALLERGLTVEPVMTLGSTEAIKRAVMEGVGVAIVSGLAIRLEVAAGKLAEVRVKSLRFRERVENLELIAEDDTAPKEGKLEKLRQSASADLKVTAAAELRVQSELNVIGQTTDEAVDAVDKFLDEASMANLTKVRIVHGHGTGALRRAIGGLLDGHPHVERFLPAPPDQGGTGATLVELRQ